MSGGQTGRAAIVECRTYAIPRMMGKVSVVMVLSFLQSLPVQVLVELDSARLTGDAG